MARASIRTILSLDKYAKIMGINPAFFSGGGDIDLSDGRVLFPISNSQNDVWPQYSWQNFDQVSRESLAMEIFKAEIEISRYLGFYPLPVWTEEERKDFPMHYRPELQYVGMMYDVAYNAFQVKPDYAYFISGGRRETSLIVSGTTVTYSDPDADSWKELATISVTIPSGTDPLEVKVYYTGYSADQTYEIRDPKSKTLSGNTLTFTYNSWQLIDPDLYEQLDYNDNTSKWINFDDPSVFVSKVDVYREYNDTTKNHVVFYEVDSVTGSVTTQGGFLNPTFENRFVSPVQANYNSSTSSWDIVYNACAYPNYMKLWYYSGMRDSRNKSLDADSYLSNDFSTAIAYIATARLERVFYANNNATSLATSLREDHLRSDRDNFKAQIMEAHTNPFGTKEGELRAWRIVNRYYTSLRSGGSL